MAHPSTKGPPPAAISAEYWRDGKFLLVRFVAEEDADRVAWPLAGQSERADDLWRETCFEVFVRTSEGYLEFNLSPSSRWASYRFDGYRAGMRPAEERAVCKGLWFDAFNAVLEAQIELPADADRLGFSAVIKTTDGSSRYWALAHPSDKPDFHHPDSFVLDLP